jgi:hypothetical protein
VSDVAAAPQYEIRPTRREARSTAAIVGWTVFCVLNVLASDGQMRVLTAGSGVAGLLVTVGLVYRWRRRALLALSGETLTYTGLFKRRVIGHFPLSGRVVTAGVAWPTTGRTSQRWLLLDADGRAELALDLTAWDRDDLNALSDRLGIPQEVDPTSRRPVELRRTYPGSAHWILARPYQFTFVLIAAVSIVLLVLGVR